MQNMAATDLVDTTPIVTVVYDENDDDFYDETVISPWGYADLLKELVANANTMRRSGKPSYSSTHISGGAHAQMLRLGYRIDEDKSLIVVLYPSRNRNVAMDVYYLSGESVIRTNPQFHQNSTVVDSLDGPVEAQYVYAKLQAIRERVLLAATRELFKLL